MSGLKRGDSVGYAYLISHLGLQLPPLPCAAKIGAVTAVTRTTDALLIPSSVAPTDKTILSHVLFALKHEGTNLGVLRLTLPHLDLDEFTRMLNDAPNSAYLRITGYLREAFTDIQVNSIPDIGGSYVDLFDPDRYYTGSVVKNTRWRVNANGIGSLKYCPVVRKTPEIEALKAQNILGKVIDFFAHSAPPDVMDRALSWAYLSETEGSFALEKETPQDDKKTIFVKLLQQAHDPRAMSEDYLVELQNSAVTNPFDQATQYRTGQNWLRSRGIRGPAGVTYVPPRPEEASSMMTELLTLLNSKPASLDPVMLGAIVSFGFVFIHPFMDGNGRLSRFLMHYTLCQSGLLQDGWMLPISVAMKRNESDYLKTLQGFSRPTRALWRVQMQDTDSFICETDADDTMYRYWDATDSVHFIYRMALNALENDLAAETRYLMSFDTAYRMVNDRHDLRDNDLNNLIMWCTQNHGRISKKRREQLGHLYREDVFDTIEEAVAAAFPPVQEPAPPPSGD